LTGRSKKTSEHMFSIELKSKYNLKNISYSNAKQSNVIVEGHLGKLIDIKFTEGIMLEINGANGSLRMDLSEKEFEKLIPKQNNMVKGRIEKQENL
jgi:hypothetical protein